MSEAEQLAWDSNVQVPNGLDPLSSAQDHYCRAAFTHPSESTIAIQMVQSTGMRSSLVRLPVSSVAQLI